jgi:hypothetical protein
MLLFAGPCRRGPLSSNVRPHNTLRTLLGFLAAPLAPAVVAWLLSLAPSLTGVSLPGSFFALSVLYGYPLAALFGVPVYFYFRHKDWLRFWQVATAGVAIGSIVPVALGGVLVVYKVSEVGLVAAARGGLREAGPLILFGAAVGALCASTFWLVALAHLGRASERVASRSAA